MAQTFAAPGQDAGLCQKSIRNGYCNEAKAQDDKVIVAMAEGVKVAEQKVIVRHHRRQLRLVQR